MANDNRHTAYSDLEPSAGDDPVGLDVDDPKAPEIVEGALAPTGSVEAQAEQLRSTAQAGNRGRRAQAASSVKNAISLARLAT